MECEFKDNKVNGNSKDLTGKDWLTQIFLSSKELEIMALKKKAEWEKEHEKIIIAPQDVGTFIHRMNLLYKEKEHQHIYLTYESFCTFIYNHYALCQKHAPQKYLAYPTIVTYFKKERAGESVRQTG